MIASLILMDQGISVAAVTFDSPFFSCERGRWAAAEIGISWRSVDFTTDIIRILRDPSSGFGGYCNPCIDCHARMFEVLFEICDGEGFDFVFSGEVTGQRPMSQNRGSLNRVARLSGRSGRLLRPLSALLLRPTDPETEGLVDRSRLLDISGRGRKRQMELAEHYGITYVNPAGGCLLTEPGYSRRLGRLMAHPDLLTGDNARLIRYGRMFEIDEGIIGLVGRSKKDNEDLEALAEPGRTFVIPDLPGPTGVIIGPFAPSHVSVLGSLIALYAKRVSGESVVIRSMSGPECTVSPADPAHSREMMVC